MLTRNQIIHLYTTGREAGMDHNQVKAELSAIYGVSTSKDLTYDQYREYARHLSQLRPPKAGAQREGKAKAGYCASHPQLAEFVAALHRFNPLWPGQATAQDLECLVFVLDKFRNYRVRDRRLSHRQVRELVAKIAQFPLWVFRKAYGVYVAGATAKPEEYFIGIMAHTCRDARREADAFTHDLALT